MRNPYPALGSRKPHKVTKTQVFLKKKNRAAPEQAFPACGFTMRPPSVRRSGALRRGGAASFRMRSAPGARAKKARDDGFDRIIPGDCQYYHMVVNEKRSVEIMKKEMVPEVLMDRVARRFKLLSEPVRLDLLNQLQARGEMSVQELVEATGHMQANVSKHLGLMAREGLLARRKEGLNVYYSIADPTLSALCTLVCGQIRQEAFETREQMNGGS